MKAPKNEAVRGQWGLWYVDGVNVGFSTKEAAESFDPSSIRTSEQFSREADRDFERTMRAIRAKEAFSLALVIGVLCLLVAAGWMAISSVSQTPPCQDETMAYVMSQNFVKRQLKSPGSATFPMITSVSSRSVGGCKFAINAYVDSQNSFGAMLRTGYSAEMEYRPDTQRWHLIDLKMQ